MERELVHDVRLRAAGADVLCPREALAQEPIHLRRHLAHALPVLRGDVAQRACHHEDRDQSEQRQREARAQVLARNDDQDPDQQEDVAEDVDHEP
jgi:hypothetical protein